MLDELTLLFVELYSPPDDEKTYEWILSDIPSFVLVCFFSYLVALVCLGKARLIGKDTVSHLRRGHTLDESDTLAMRR